MGRSRGRGLVARVIMATLALVVLALEIPVAGAQQASGDFTNIKVGQAVLMDYETGAILYQHNADALVPPASMSKLMTINLTFKALKAGNRKLTDELVMSVNAWRKGGAPSGTSAMFVPVNTKVTLDDLLQGMIVQSGNDAAMCVAEGFAGNEDAFAKQMTEEARRLGMAKTVFRNATGLYHPEHLSTVRELAILARHIIREYPEFYPRFAQREFQYRKHKFFNRNRLLSVDPTVDGMKTGNIKEGGYGIVATARRDGRRLIAVVNGAPGEKERTDETKRLLDWGYKTFAPFKIYNAGEVVGSARVWGGDRMFVPLDGNGDVVVLLPRAANAQRLKGEISYQSPLKPPIRRGDQVATLKVSTPGNTVNEVPLYAAEDVAEGGVFRRGLDSLVHLAFRWLPR